MDEEEAGAAEQFAALLQGQFGHMEQHLGAEGYQEYVKNQAESRMVAEAYRKRHEAMTAIFRLVPLVVVMVAIPVIVFLWKWALGS